MILDDVTLIDKYLREELTSEEELHFKERMQDDAFKAQVASMQEIRDVVDVHGANRVKQMLQNIESGVNSNKRISSGFKWFLWIIIILFTLSLVYEFWQHQSRSTKKSLYAAHYVAFPNIDDPIVKSEGTGDALSIPQFYEMSRYENAINLFNNQPTKTLADSFYVSLSYLELGQSHMAEQILLKTVQSSSSYKPPSEFYLSLAYLNNDKWDLAEALLNSISKQSGHSFQKKALNLLKDMPPGKK